jgi:para-aminobenzoate synthetase component 1
MITLRPVVVDSIAMRGIHPPVVPKSCRGRTTERARLSWRLGDPGDPALELENFLAAQGLPVRDLSTIPTLPAGADAARHDVCGAAVFVSAAAGATMIGAPVGALSSLSDLPDVVAIVYTHSHNLTTERDDLGPSRGWRLGSWEPSWTAGEHAAAVAEVRDAIARGDVYQVNVVGHAAAEYDGDPLAALARIAAVPGAHYAGLIHGDGWAIGCASPETLIEVRHGRMLTRPIKGTAAATAAGRAELLASAKERAEHIMIVDLERNDLAHVARMGSVRVDDLFAIRRWGDLWQAESTVSADVKPGTGLAGLLRAVCPGGSVTGAPKLAALHQIAALEPVGRGAGMGALGWVGRDHIDLGLTIRTVAADPHRLHIWAGGGITWGSDPLAEVAEAAAKAAPLKALLATLS